MLIALSTARPNVRQLLRDVDVSAPAVKGYVLDQAISNHYQLIHARLHVPLEWLTVTALAAADADYTLTTPEFHSIGLFRLASNFHLVEKVSPAYMARLRNVTPNHNGEPIAVAFTEENPTAVGTTETTFQVFPTPTVSDTLQGLWAAGATVLSASTDLIQLGSNAQRAIEYSAAAELIFAMPDEEAKRLSLNPRVAKYYQEMAERYIDWEQVRISRQRSGRKANTSYKRS